MKEVTAIKFKNVFGTGIDFTLVHDPIKDGPLEMYENSKDCEIVKLKM